MKLRRIHQTSNEVESIIHENPDDDLKHYITAMNRIKDSISYFQNNFSDQVELSQLVADFYLIDPPGISFMLYFVFFVQKSLYDTGIRSLEELFASLLKRNESMYTSDVCF